MVLIGKVNSDVVTALNRFGPVALGLSGTDAQLITAEAHDAELGFVGQVTGVDTTLIERTLAMDLVPVIATIGADADGQAYNINADDVAASVAEALGAEKLIMLTDVPGLLADLLLQLVRLETVVRERQERAEALAIAVQGSVHLLALGGLALPLQSCARSGEALQPPVGHWDWRCSLLPQEGLVIGAIPGARLVLNASELALLQRLPRAGTPRRRDGDLLGPERVWLHLLELIEVWWGDHLSRRPRAFRLLRAGFEPGEPAR
jgi:hypothetical protein